MPSPNSYLLLSLLYHIFSLLSTHSETDEDDIRQSKSKKGARPGALDNDGEAEYIIIEEIWKKECVPAWDAAV